MTKVGIQLYNSKELVGYYVNNYTYKGRVKNIDNLFSELDCYLSNSVGLKNIFQAFSPCIMPIDQVEYQDILKITEDLCLTPETTKASYEIANYLINNNKVKNDFIVYQEGQCFRKGADLQCFTQREYQFLTQKEKIEVLALQENITEQVLDLVQRYLTKKARIAVNNISNKYIKTLDIEITPEEWLKICSISIRNDFETKGKGNYLNIEIAFNVSRMLYCEL